MLSGRTQQYDHNEHEHKRKKLEQNHQRKYRHSTHTNNFTRQTGTSFIQKLVVVKMTSDSLNTERFVLGFNFINFRKIAPIFFCLSKPGFVTFLGSEADLMQKKDNRNTTYWTDRL